MTKKVWMLNRPETTKRVELDGRDDITWANNYVHEYVNMKQGDVSYVTDGIEVWKVSCLIDNQGFFTELIDTDIAQNEIREAGGIDAL